MHNGITRNLGIILLSIHRRYRSPNLLDEVRSSGIEFLELDASTPEQMHYLLATSKLGQVLKRGRFLSDREIATCETHLRAQISSFSKTSKWTVIFEDDAIIDGETFNFLKSLAQFETEKPAFVNLFPNNGVVPVENIKENLSVDIIETKLLYSGAVAYAINNAAHVSIHKNLHFRTITPADYPPLFNTFEKYHSTSILVKHSLTSPSTIYGSKNSHKNRKVLRVLGVISFLTFILYRKEHVNFKNFFDLEICQRYLIRKQLRFHVS